MNKLIFSFLRMILTICLSLSMVIIYGFALLKFGFIDWLELESADFYPRLILALSSLCIMFYVAYVISIIWHELGHFYYGNKAKLKFISFNIFKFMFTKENDKLILKKSATLPGTKGYCYMAFDENENHTKKNIIFYFMGGIIFNFILVIVFLVLLLFSNNIYLDIISSIFISMNLYLVLYNLVPSVQKSGINSDMLQIINYLNDPKYIEVLSRYFTIQSLLLSGYDLNDIDEELFYMPKNFSNSSEVLMAQFYIDYISERGRYQEAIECIKKVLKDATSALTKANKNLLKIQLINCVFYADYDMKIILEYWDKDIKNYLELMGEFAPQILGINYMCASLLEKNEKKAQKILNQFEKMKKKKLDKKVIEETEKIIESVNSKVNDNFNIKM